MTDPMTPGHTSKCDCRICFDELHKRLEATEAENAKLKEILEGALSDDKYNDHSSGIWQMNAREALNLTDDEDDEP